MGKVYVHSQNSSHKLINLGRKRQNIMPPYPYMGKVLSFKKLFPLTNGFGKKRDDFISYNFYWVWQNFTWFSHWKSFWPFSKLFPNMDGWEGKKKHHALKFIFLTNTLILQCVAYTWSQHRYLPRGYLPVLSTCWLVVMSGFCVRVTPPLEGKYFGKSF